MHLLLAAKGLSYSVKDVTPGVGQIELFQLTGQRQVPVLRDGEQLIADSSAIAMHLESKHPDPALLVMPPSGSCCCWKTGLIRPWPHQRVWRSCKGR